MRTQVASGVSQRKVKWFPASLNKSYKAFWKALVLKREVLNLYWFLLAYSYLRRHGLLFQCNVLLDLVVLLSELRYFGLAVLKDLFCFRQVVCQFWSYSRRLLGHLFHDSGLQLGPVVPETLHFSSEVLEIEQNITPQLIQDSLVTERISLVFCWIQLEWKLTSITRTSSTEVKTRKKSFQIILPSDVIA